MKISYFQKLNQEMLDGLLIKEVTECLHDNLII